MQEILPVMQLLAGPELLTQQLLQDRLILKGLAGTVNVNDTGTLVAVTSSAATNTVI